MNDAAPPRKQRLVSVGLRTAAVEESLVSNEV
jgi:hypothetical protein